MPDDRVDPLFMVRERERERGPPLHGEREGGREGREAGRQNDSPVRGEASRRYTLGQAQMVCVRERGEGGG